LFLLALAIVFPRPSIGQDGKTTGKGKAKEDSNDESAALTPEIDAKAKRRGETTFLCSNGKHLGQTY
jgi:hypothetical protein